MDIRKTINKIITTLLDSIHERRKVLLALSCLVVFVTTYVLILPAFTLDKDEATEQGGIDVPAVEQSVDADETSEATDAQKTALKGEKESAKAVEDSTAKESAVESAEDDKEPVAKENTESVAGETDKETGKQSAEKAGKDDAEDAVKDAAKQTPEGAKDTAKPTSKEAAESAAKSEAPTDVTLTNKDSDDFTIAVEGKDAGLSEDMSVSVREIDQNDRKQKKEYESLYKDALEAVQDAHEEEGLEKPSDFAFAKFYDISLMNGKTEVEPDAAVDVKISFGKDLQKELKVTDPDRVHIVHFAVDKNTGEVTPEVLDTEDTDITVKNNKVTEAAFTADSFSVFAVVYTVDFHWEVNGKVYEFSFPGGGFVSFTDLVEVLGIAGDVEVSENTEKFVADVENVKFSSPELMDVSKVDEDTTVGQIKESRELECQYSSELTEEQIAEINAQAVEAGDWALISLQPFDTEEMLTITMKDGEVFAVRVTDAAYDGTLITNLNDATGALVNKTNNNAVLGIAQNSTTLQAVAVTVNGNQITTADGSPDLTQWTFNFTANRNGYDHYTIRCDAGYLNLGNRSATISQNAQELIVVTRQSNGETQIRIANDSHDALNNEGNNTANGYKAYNNWDYNTNPGEWFTVYQLAVQTVGNVLDNQTFSIINNRDGGNNWQALRDEIDDTKDGRGYYVSGNATTYSNVDGVDYSNRADVDWTFEYVGEDGKGSLYRIKSSNGYLYIDPDVTKKSDMPSNQSHSYEHALRIESSAGDGSSSDGTLIRVVQNGDGTYLLQNRNGVSLWNYGNNQFWLSTLTQDGESATSQLNSRFRLTKPMDPPHVTIHYVDRDGNVLTGVKYNGSNTDVVDNGDGTFMIPYNTSGNVDLRSQFDFTKIGEDKLTYTYANTHLDGKDSTGNNLEHEGYMIDSLLTASNGDLFIKTDTGETNFNWMTEDGNVVLGNLAYGSLKSYSLSGRIYTRPTNNAGNKLPYALSNNKDIYVVLDPLPANSSSGGPGSVNPGTVDEPSLNKSMSPNNDGTYTLSLKVDAHAKNISETNKANILFVVDTSSSMRKTTTAGHTRITDTHDAVKEFGDKLLAYNGNHPGAVQLSMITFDGGVEERLSWTSESASSEQLVTQFDGVVDEYLRYYYLHTGTDWEDAMKTALHMVQNPPDSDPTFVVFFTDGEPSQYTNFHGAGENTNTDVQDPITHGTAHESVSGGYPNFYSYFLSREGSKDEMRALVNAGAQLYGVYAYNTTNESYNGYNGPEDGAKMLHNAIRYGYNATGSLEDNLFYEAKNTEALQKAFDKIFNLITESVGFSNLVVKDGLTKQVTSSTVVDGDVSGFTYIIKNKAGALDYKVTVAPNGVPSGQTVADGTPLFWFSEGGPPVVGQKKTITVTKLVKEGDNIQPVEDEVEVYYYKDSTNPDAREYIMPISTTGENIEWDLSPLGILQDGYSYEVNFVVWPNQGAYDLVADLNNGKRPDIEGTANWEAQPIQTDSSGRQYRQGGFPNYPYISRYEDNGVYSTMSNTDQRVDYIKVDKKIKNGNEVTEYTQGGKTVPHPDPMPLTASYSHLEKLWNVERDPAIFAQYLYNTDGSSKGFKVDFDVFQGNNLTTPYTVKSLGWVYDLTDEGDYIYLGENETGDYVLEKDTGKKRKGHYVWAEGDTMTNVPYAGHWYQIGTRWADDFSIATGLMLSSAQMEARGLNKSHYPSAEFEGVTYYILEPGHNYTIKEHQTGDIGYEFDFSSPVYHPMLVDNVLKNVEIEYTTDSSGKIETATISGISDNEEGLSGLEIKNTLRGYINLNKVVVDEQGNNVESDNTKFEYEIKLENSSDVGPFEGDHIPWYGISGLFYNDGHENYYQVYEGQNGVWKIRNEKNEEYVVTSTGFDSDEVGPQTVTYRIDENRTGEIVLYGNRMTATADGKTATATLAITQKETLNIANVPVGTQYTITENTIDGYSLVRIWKEVRNGNTVESSADAAESDFNARKITGEIVSNRDNHVTFKNRIIRGALQITKTIQKNGTKDNSATGTFYYAVYDEQYDPSADPAQTPVRTGHIDVTANGTATVTEPDLKIGDYYVYELTGEGGTPVISGQGFFSDGKYYAVTTSGSPATVAEGATSTVGIVNNYETIPVDAEKTWDDLSTNQSAHPTIYFKLYYRTDNGDVAVNDAKLKPLPNGTTTVTWSDMPKYDENGTTYQYLVKEFIQKDNGEYVEDNVHYTEAAPNGYVSYENGLSITNTQSSTYEPKTSYSGQKIWVDSSNSGSTRPENLTVRLMIDKTGNGPSSDDEEAKDGNGQPYMPSWQKSGDVWTYTIGNGSLPVFDSNDNIIKYYAVEEPVTGYQEVTHDYPADPNDPENLGITPTKYEYLNTATVQHETNDANINVPSDVDNLPFVGIKMRNNDVAYGYSYHIWSVRETTEAEKTELLKYFNNDLEEHENGRPATMNNTRFVNGLPVSKEADGNVEFLYRPNGFKVSINKGNGDTLKVTIDGSRYFDCITVGSLKYDYDSGKTVFKNELKTTYYDVQKTWDEGQTPPDGAEVTIKLKATIPGTATDDDPNPAPVPVALDTLGLTQNTEVKLNGGKEGGDDTAQDPWKYRWSNLPQYDKAGNKITYSVAEISYKIDGVPVDLEEYEPVIEPAAAAQGGESNGSIITNKTPDYSFEILKVDEKTARPLPGAKFTIQPVEPTSATESVITVSGSTETSGNPETTGADGKMSFENVAIGYYQVMETEIPDGYIITGDKAFYIKVDATGIKLLEKVISEGEEQPKLSFKEAEADEHGNIKVGNVTFTIYGNTVTIIVENEPGAELPHSGGIGTTIFYVLGSLLVIGSAVILVARRRLRRN